MIDMPTKRVVERVSKAFGIDPASIGHAHFAAAARDRMALLGVDSIEAYEQLLDQSPMEAQAYFELIAIPESWFFRDQAPFELLARLAKERIKAMGPEEKIRILSLPCAGGEEPYSIAIALLEAGMGSSRIAVDAADASIAGLARAEAALYGANSFRGRPAQSFPEFLEPEGEAWRVSSAAHGLVQFFRSNIVEPNDRLLSNRYHYIFSRNLLIYLDGASREKAVANLEQLLEPSGVLFMGHSDALPSVAGRFLAIEPVAAFAYRRKTDPAADGSTQSRQARIASQPEKKIKAKPRGAAVSVEPTRPKPRASQEPLASAANIHEQPVSWLEEGRKLADQGDMKSMPKPFEKSSRRKARPPNVFT